MGVIQPISGGGANRPTTQVKTSARVIAPISGSNKSTNAPGAYLKKVAPEPEKKPQTLQQKVLSARETYISVRDSINKKFADKIGLKEGEGLGAPIGRALQQIAPKITPPKVPEKYKLPNKPIVEVGRTGGFQNPANAIGYYDDVVDFIGQLPGSLAQGYGKSLEMVGTPEGKKELKQGIKDLPKTLNDVKTHIANKEWGEAISTAFSNPAISVALDVSDFIPVSLGFKVVRKELLKKFVKETLEEVEEKVVKTTAKESAKQIEPSVVQIVNTETNEKTFKTIPKGELPTYQKLVDDTQTGIAGKNINGNVYHLTAKSPEQMAEKGFKDGGIVKTTDIPTNTQIKTTKTDSKPKPVQDVTKSVRKEQIQNLKDATGVKRILKDVRSEIESARQVAESAKQVRQPFSSQEAKNISKYRETFWKSDSLQAGDVETMRKKYGDDFSKTLENIQEKNRAIKSDDEAFEVLKAFPKTSYLDANLVRKEKQLASYFETLKAKQEQLKIKSDDSLTKEWEMALSQQEELAKIVKVPKNQLPVGEGKEKLSRLEARVTKSLDKAPDDVKNLSTFQQMNKKEQIARASAYVIKNPDEALAVLRGEIDAPKGLLNNSIYVAMQNLAEGDVALARKLASLSSTKAGQEISILTEINPDSPVKAMTEIVKVREEAFKRRYGGKSVNDVSKKVVSDIQSKVKKPNKYDWSSFISSIQC